MFQMKSPILTVFLFYHRYLSGCFRKGLTLQHHVVGVWIPHNSVNMCYAVRTGDHSPTPQSG